MEKGKEDGSESALHLVIHLVIQSVHRVSSNLEVDEFFFQSSFVEGLAFKFENMVAAVVPSSRGSLEWAAQQDTQILTVDDVEAGPDSVEINPQVHVALAEILEGEALDIVQNTTRGAGLEASRKLVRRFD